MADILEKIALILMREGRVLTVQQRQKRKQIMKRIQSKLKARRKQQDKRLADPKRLMTRSRRAAVSLLKARFAGEKGKKYKDLSAAEKVQIDKLISKHLNRVGGLAKRLLPGVRKKDQDRVRSRQQVKEENLQELSKKTLGSYINKALDDTRWTSRTAGKFPKNGVRISKAKAEKFSKLNRRRDGVNLAVKKLTKEEVITELSKSALGRYINKASISLKNTSYDLGKDLGKDGDWSTKRIKNFTDNKRKVINREKGITKATGKLTKESVEVASTKAYKPPSKEEMASRDFKWKVSDLQYALDQLITQVKVISGSSDKELGSKLSTVDLKKIHKLRDQLLNVKDDLLDVNSELSKKIYEELNNFSNILSENKYHSVWYKSDGKWMHHMDCDTHEDAKVEKEDLKSQGVKHVKKIIVSKSKADWRNPSHVSDAKQKLGHEGL